jgi:tetratricopeptide (TPR) repeat protein
VEALADFDQAIVLAPRSARAHANRALVLYYQNKDREAEASLARAEELSDGDDDFVAMKVRGLIEWKRRKPAEAAQAFSRALSVDPDDSDMLSMRASAYASLNRHADALADLERAARIEPTAWGLYRQQARLSASRGEQAAALAAADKVIAVEDGRIDGLSLKAELLSRFGRKDEARSVYTEALAAIDGRIARASPEEEKSRLKRAKVSLLAEAGLGREAIDLAGTLLRENPNSALALNARCWTRMLLNVELEQALRDCEQALKQDPEASQVIDSRAWVKLRLGRFDDAIADFDKALGIQPGQAASLFGRGLAKMRKGDKAGGEVDMAAARQLDFAVDSEFRHHGITQ